MYTSLKCPSWPFRGLICVIDERGEGHPHRCDHHDSLGFLLQSDGWVLRRSKLGGRECRLHWNSIGERGPLFSYIKIECLLCYGPSISTSTNVERDVLGYGGDTCAFCLLYNIVGGRCVGILYIRVACNEDEVIGLIFLWENFLLRTRYLVMYWSPFWKVGWNFWDLFFSPLKLWRDFRI